MIMSVPGADCAAAAAWFACAGDNIDKFACHTKHGVRTWYTKQV